VFVYRQTITINYDRCFCTVLLIRIRPIHRFLPRRTYRFANPGWVSWLVLVHTCVPAQEAGFVISETGVLSTLRHAAAICPALHAYTGCLRRRVGVPLKRVFNPTRPFITIASDKRPSRQGSPIRSSDP